MRGGGRRQIREEQAKHRTMGQAAKSKFDSIAQAYNSSQAQAVTIMRDDYESSSQQDFTGGLASMIVAAGPHTTL